MPSLNELIDVFPQDKLLLKYTDQIIYELWTDGKYFF